VREDPEKFFRTHLNYEVDFADVKGQESVKAGAEVAAAGGTTSSWSARRARQIMLSSAIPTILPQMSLDESAGDDEDHSITGLLKKTRHGGHAPVPLAASHD